MAGYIEKQLEENLLLIIAEEALDCCHRKATSLEHAVVRIAEGNSVILDFAKVTFMDECATGYLLEAYLKAQKKKLFFALSGATDRERFWRIYVTMVDKVVPVYADVDAARQAYIRVIPSKI